MNKLLETVKEKLCVRRIIMYTNAVITIFSSLAWSICYFADMTIARYWEGIAVMGMVNILINTQFYWEAIYNVIKEIRKEENK